MCHYIFVIFSEWASLYIAFSQIREKNKSKILPLYRFNFSTYLQQWHIWRFNGAMSEYIRMYISFHFYVLYIIFFSAVFLFYSRHEREEGKTHINGYECGNFGCRTYLYHYYFILMGKRFHNGEYSAQKAKVKPTPVSRNKFPIVHEIFRARILNKNTWVFSVFFIHALTYIQTELSDTGLSDVSYC